MNQQKQYKAGIVGKTFSKTSVLIICAALVIGTVIAYEPLRHNGFVSYDDGRYITENPYVQQGLNFETLKWAFAEAHFFMWHPLTTISYLLEYDFFGANPFVSHLINLIFHIVNVLLAFWFFREISGVFWPSVFAAAIFALHPLQVESVAWAAERKSVLSAFFWLLTMWAYVQYCRKSPAKYYLLTIIFFAFAAMSKPMVVTLPFVLLLLDFWPLGRMNSRTIGKLVVEKIPLFLFAAVLSVITIIAQKGGGVIKTMPHFALPYRFENAIVSYISYLFKFIYPVNLAVFYPHLGPKIPLWQPITAFAALVLITILVFYFGRQRRYLITGWLWYAGTLAPVIGLIQVGGQAMADRYMYLPMFGLLIIIAKAISETWQKWRYAFFAASAVIFIVLMVITHKQVGYWHNDFTLFGHAIAATKDNENMHYNLANAYQKKGQFNQAVQHYSEALRIMPGDLQAMNNLGVILLSQKKVDEAMEIFEKAVRLNSRYIDSLNNLGLALREKGRNADALQKWRQVLELDPQQPQAHYNIGISMLRTGRYKEAVEHFKKSLEKNKSGDVYNYLGAAYAAVGDFTSALDNYKEALKLKPGDMNIQSNIAMMLTKLGRSNDALLLWQDILSKDPDSIKAYYGLGLLFEEKKEFGQAAKYFEKLLEKKPDRYEVHFRIANVYYRQKDLTSAVGHLRQAVKLKTDYLEALNLLAWLEATAKEQSIRNPDEAVRLAGSACELTENKNPGLLDTLAVAYASAGRFDDAVKKAEQALKLAEEYKLTKMAEDIGKRLEMFKTNQPYYED